MSACNQRPPQGHPFHGTGVACHLADDHLEFGEPHSWDIDAALERHDRLGRALAALRAKFPERPIGRMDAQLPHPIVAYDVDPETGERGRPYRQWEMPSGPWLVVAFEDGEEFGIWKHTGAVFRIGPDGAVEDDPIIEP